MADLSQLLASINPDSEEYGQYLNKLATIDPQSSSMNDAPAPMPIPQAQPLNLPAKIAASNPGEDATEEASADSDTETEAPSNTSTMVQDAIKKSYGFGPQLNDQALQRAQQSANNTQLIAGIGSGLDQMIQGIAHQNQSPQSAAFFQNLGKSGEQNVQNILQRRQGEIQNQALAKKQELEDPSSSQSQAFQNTLKKLYPDTFSDDDLKNISAEDMDLVFKPLALKEQIEARKQQAEANLQMRQAMLQNHQNVAQENNVVKAYQAAQNDDVVKKAKGQLSQADELLAATNDATSNPASANALSVLASRYLTGGQRINQQEMQAMGSGAKDISDRLQQIFTTGREGTLTPENAAFMKQFIAVTRQSAQNAYQDALKDRADSYSKAYGIPAQKLYDVFGVDASRLVKQPSGPHSSLSPMDQQALQWAQANSSDPKAKKILALLGA